MSNRMVGSIALRPDADADVRLRGGVGRTAFLSIGNTVEITLHEAQVLALRGHVAAALGDMALVDAADEVAGEAYDAGAQARRAMTLAREQADAADLRGDVESAWRLRQAADQAAGVADVA